MVPSLVPNFGGNIYVGTICTVSFVVSHCSIVLITVRVLNSPIQKLVVFKFSLEFSPVSQLEISSS
jgi:hypothetical protein